MASPIRGLCASQGEALAPYAVEGRPNQTLVREYRTVLPREQLLADEIARFRRLLEARLAARRTLRNRR